MGGTYIKRKPTYIVNRHRPIFPFEAWNTWFIISSLEQLFAVTLRDRLCKRKTLCSHNILMDCCLLSRFFSSYVRSIFSARRGRSKKHHKVNTIDRKFSNHDERERVLRTRMLQSFNNTVQVTTKKTYSVLWSDLVSLKSWHALYWPYISPINQNLRNIELMVTWVVWNRNQFRWKSVW